MNNAFLMTLGRVLLGVYFLLPGIMKFVAWDMHIESMTATGISSPAPLLLIATIVEILAGLFLIMGSYVRFMALGCALLILVINTMMHDFWNFDGIAGAHETQNFVKNLGIFAGLLVLASVSPKRKISLNRFWKSDGKVS
jgi:putative oxidoreductase